MGAETGHMGSGVGCGQMVVSLETGITTFFGKSENRGSERRWDWDMVMAVISSRARRWFVRWELFVVFDGGDPFLCVAFHVERFP